MNSTPKPSKHSFTVGVINMKKGKLLLKIEFKMNAWDRAGLIAGILWRKAIGLDYEKWMIEQIEKHVHFGDIIRG